MLKHGITFSLHKRNTDESSDVETYFPVRMRVSFNGQRPDFYTGVNIREIDWNPETQRSWQKKGFENRELDKLETIISDIFDEFEYESKRFPTVVELRNAFKIATNKKPIQDNAIKVSQVIDDFIERRGAINQWTKKTYQRYEKLKHHFDFFAPGKNIDELTEKDLLSFIKYFQTAPIDFTTNEKKEPHKNTTIARTFRDFKSVLIWAAEEGIYKGKLTSFTPKFKGAAGDLKEIVFLTWDELMKLTYYQFENSSKSQVRDMFCFCCFTGLRYSDLVNLKKSNIRQNTIIVTTTKTTDPLRIEINDYSREILDKYIEMEYPGKKVFPVISNQKFNDALKKIGEDLEFDEEINDVYFIGEKRYEKTFKKFEVLSSHAGRRTFVVNGLTLGIPSEVIMKWTGHKNFAAMKPYVKIVDDLKESEMKKFNKR